MGLTKCLIILDQPVYHSGQILSGRLVVQVDKPMPVRGIYLKYSGEARVQWSETYRIGSVTTVMTYANIENYLERQQLVFGNDTEDSELPEGEHVFVFNCQLPTNSPSSFESPCGRVRYSVIAKINRPWKFNHVTKQPFTVMSICDLNHVAFATAPVEEESSKTFWGQSSKQLNMSINLPVRGFVSGQIIPIKVFLNNESGIQVKSLFVSLDQILTLHATAKSKTDKVHVFRNEFPVPNGMGRDEVLLNLQLPASPPSYLQFCEIIDLSYQLRVQAKVNAWYHRNLSIRTELIVGNVPVISYQRPVPMLHKPVDQEKPSHSQAPDYQADIHGLVAPPGLTYADLAPPTYEQSIGRGKSGNENKKNVPDGDGEVTEFSPLYAVYKFETTQA